MPKTYKITLKSGITEVVRLNHHGAVIAVTPYITRLLNKRPASLTEVIASLTELKVFGGINEM